MHKMTKEQVVGRFANEVLNEGAFESVIKEKVDECFLGKVVKYEMKYGYPDLGERDVLVSYFPIEGANGIDRLACIVQDITERKLAELDVAPANDRLRMAMESGKSVGWDRDVKSGRDILFGDLESIFGIPAQIHKGRVEDFHLRVHPEDRMRIRKAIDGAMERQEPYASEFRVVLPDGVVRWLSAKGKFYYSPGGAPERMTGMAVDITERKLAEDALSTVSQRLIEAQEQERSRVARELHDDINQRLALLAVGLERLKSDVPGPSSELRQRVVEARTEVADIGKDIQALSHRLHSPKLELLGLAETAKGFCRELSELQSVRVDFHSESVPKELPYDVSLCLFRVLQEALQNAVKHSGSRRVEITLNSLANEIDLIVVDSGTGFDPGRATKGRGLGLTSMRERLKLVSGELAIASEMGHGTTVRARVPLR